MNVTTHLFTDREMGKPPVSKKKKKQLQDADNVQKCDIQIFSFKGLCTLILPFTPKSYLNFIKFKFIVTNVNYYSKLNSFIVHYFV